MDGLSSLISASKAAKSVMSILRIRGGSALVKPVPAAEKLGTLR